MVKFRGQSQAFGSPGIAPRWTHANKGGVGTAYFTASRIGFTVWNGAVTEVYHPALLNKSMNDAIATEPYLR